MTKGNEAFSRVFIDGQLKDQGWNTHDQNSVRYEYVLNAGRADYALCDRHGRALAVIEAKRFSISPGDATEQAKAYAQELNVPYIFLANGKEIRFWEWEREAFPRPVKTFFKQDDLERRFATRQVRQDPLAVPIDTRIAGGQVSASNRLHRHPEPRNHPRAAQAVGRNGDRHRQDPHGGGLHQTAISGECHYPRAIPGGSYPTSETNRRYFR